MKASVDLMMSDESACAIPVSPVQFDLGALRKPLFARSERLRFVAIAALCLGLHAVLLLMLDPKPEVTQIEEAIPVEVIIEPPPEEAPPQPEPEKEEEQKKVEEAQPEEPAQTIKEKAATDFARAADQDLEDGKASEQSEAESKAREDIRQDVEAAVEPPPPDTPPEKKPPEVQAAIEPPPPDPAPEPIQDATPEPLPAPPPPATPAPRFTGFSPLPEFQFKEPLAKRSDFPKGSAEPGYLSTLYGLIMRKMPSLPNHNRPMRGRVTFAIMSNGRIYQESIAIPSGAPLLDAAALGAVRRAAPFPAPPKGGPVYIRFDYGSR
ncbi:MAG: energy transducer TonB [Hyphomicrobiales bacterium]|nr:energy transducer TonB [Hyphomicrobiales bacterium]